ncbi:MAG: hypothetical protein ABFD20_00095, partial [Anaerolineales bacterium]
ASNTRRRTWPVGASGSGVLVAGGMGVIAGAVAMTVAGIVGVASAVRTAVAADMTLGFAWAQAARVRATITIPIRCNARVSRFVWGTSSPHQGRS